MVFKDLMRNKLQVCGRQLACLIIVLSFSGCSLWPYKHDFDCPVGDGVRCTSLYEISQMADRGDFGPDSKRHAALKAKQERAKSPPKKRKFRGRCNCPKPRS